MKKIGFLILIGLCLLALPVHAQINLLHEFAGGEIGVSDGANPWGSVILSGTTLYGMTQYGGTYNAGMIYTIQTDGSGFTVLHEFTGGATEGSHPIGALTLSGTTLYGMTYEGGSNYNGTIFKIETNGSGFTLLRTFVGGADDGRHPYGSLFIAGNMLYGMTWYGGDSNLGTIFAVQTDGSNYGQRDFAGGANDGALPEGSLVTDGTASYGMTPQGGYGWGTIFKVDTGGFTLLHRFTGTAGGTPNDSLIVSGSTLYGMTSYGGGSSMGTIFKVQTDGSGFTLLHEFAGGANDGSSPQGSLILSGTTLYGMTRNGGDSDKGTVFKIETDGSGFALGHEFTGGAADGAYPYRSLLLVGSTLYGTTYGGGDSDKGVVFSLPVFSIISGAITMGGSPLSGVVMSGLPGNPVTNASGVYTAVVTNGWNGTVTPTLAGYTFSPVNRVYANVTANQTAQDYTATLATYTISGTVTASGSGLANVVMSGLTGDPITNASGAYSGTVTFGWSGTVTPTLAGYTFTPVNRVYTNVAADQTARDYAANPVPATINVSPSSLYFGYVPPGSYRDLIVEVKNVGGGILTGTVSATAPFSIVSGGNYSLGVNQSQQIVVRYTAPLQEGSQTASLTFTGGGGITIQMKGTNKKVGLPWLLLLLGN